LHSITLATRCCLRPSRQLPAASPQQQLPHRQQRSSVGDRFIAAHTTKIPREYQCAPLGISQQQQQQHFIRKQNIALKYEADNTGDDLA